MLVSLRQRLGYAAGARRGRRDSVVIVAPHPDDDAIGCSGALQRMAARGAGIWVVYVTDGSASHVKSKRFPPMLLRDIREAEARAALRLLGVRARIRFLRAPDGQLSNLEPAAREALIETLARIVDRGRAHIVLGCRDDDPHPDHVATAALLREALRRCGRRPAHYTYGVWFPVSGGADDSGVQTHEIRLSAHEVARKRAAILAHRSQCGDLIDDDPDGFCIDEALLSIWLSPVERFYRGVSAATGRSEDDRRPGSSHNAAPQLRTR